MALIENLKKDILKLANPKQATLLQKFFKTGKGEYGEGDIFLGLKVPDIRKITKQFSNIQLDELQELLNSKIHEHRLAALLILVDHYEKHSERRKEIFDFYLKNTKYINNWDLVDLSAPSIIGRFIFNTGKSYPVRVSILFKLAESENIWERRIAILATYYFIKNNRFDEILAISKSMLEDNHDLIHKAAGWMLREVGKKDIKVLEEFLRKNYKDMPRTMLRYAIERFPEDLRQAYLKREVK